MNTSHDEVSYNEIERSTKVRMQVVRFIFEETRRKFAILITAVAEGSMPVKREVHRKLKINKLLQKLSEYSRKINVVYARKLVAAYR